MRRAVPVVIVAIAAGLLAPSGAAAGDSPVVVAPDPTHIRGTVTDPLGRGIDACVSVSPADRGRGVRAGTSATVIADPADGSWEVEVIPGPYQVRAIGKRHESGDPVGACRSIHLYEPRFAEFTPSDVVTFDTVTMSGSVDLAVQYALDVRVWGRRCCGVDAVQPGEAAPITATGSRRLPAGTEVIWRHDATGERIVLPRHGHDLREIHDQFGCPRTDSACAAEGTSPRTAFQLPSVHSGHPYTMWIEAPGGQRVSPEVSGVVWADDQAPAVIETTPADGADDVSAQFASVVLEADDDGGGVFTVFLTVVDLTEPGDPIYDRRQMSGDPSRRLWYRGLPPLTPHHTYRADLELRDGADNVTHHSFTFSTVPTPEPCPLLCQTQRLAAGAVPAP